MGLGAYIQDGLESLGLNGSDIKPINQGEPVTIVEDSDTSGSVWGLLDSAGESVSNGVGSYFEALLGKQINKLTKGPEASADSTGDPDEQTGQNYQIQPVGGAIPFIDKNKLPIMAGVGVLAIVGAIMWSKR